MQLSAQKVNGRTLWLGILCILLVLMIGVGGITRLTRSGLSIVEWNVVMGTLPPLTEEAWQSQFELYQKTPEFQKINAHFELSDYKRIFFWEYFHRLLGRLIFFTALVPGLILVRRKQATMKEVFILSGLVALQGFIGWFMVKSGLTHMPRVSPYRLTFHYLTALSILGVVFWWFLKSIHEHLQFKPVQHPLKIKLSLWGLCFGFFIQLIYGGLTAGLKAGFVYNTYPLMERSFFPPQPFAMDPWFVNLFENVSTVQWIHRWNAVFVLLLAGHFYRNLKASGNKFYEKSGKALLHVLAFQVGLGILTLVLKVPVWLGVIHQVFAAILLLAILRCLWIFRRMT